MGKQFETQTELNSDLHVTIGQASKYLGVSIDTIRRWERAGRITAHRLDGKNRYFNESDLLRFKQMQPMTTTEVAKALGVSASTVRRLEHQGELKPLRDASGRRMYDTMAVSEYVTRLERKSTAPKVAQPVTKVGAKTAVRTKMPQLRPAIASEARHASTVYRAPRQSLGAYMSGFGAWWQSRRQNNRGSGSKRIGMSAIALLLLLILTTILVAPWRARNDGVKTNEDTQLNLIAGADKPAKIDLSKLHGSATLNLPSTFFVQLPKSGLVINITNQAIEGQAIAGNYADKPVTSDEIAVGGISFANLSPEVQALIKHAGAGAGAGAGTGAGAAGGSTVVNNYQTNVSQTTVLAGLGLSGSTSNNVLTLNVKTGTSTKIVNNSLEVAVSSGSGLEDTGSGLQLLGSCASGQILQWNGSAWACATVAGGGGSVAVEEGGATVTAAASGIDFNGSDFNVVDNAGTATIAIDYANSGVARIGVAEAITGNWSFKDSGFTLSNATDGSKQARFDLSGVASGTTRTLSVPNTSGTLITTGNLTSITGTGALTSGSIGGSFGAISTSSNISTTAALQGGSLSIGSGAFAVNNSGAITAATGVVSSGTIQFTDLSPAGVVHANGSGVLSTGAVILGTDTSGAYVQSLGSTTGLTVGGTASVPTLSVIYGSGANTAAQGNTALTFSGSGNLTGSLSGTAGGGFTTTTLAVSSTPSFTSVSAGSFSGPLTGNVSGNVSGNAGTATALAANPSDCSATTFAQSIDAQGNLTCALVALGTNTTGAYVQSVGATNPSLSVGGTASNPTLSVVYGSGANTAAQGNSALSFTGSGNLTGTISGTAGGGFTTNTLDVVSAPTFSGAVSVNSLTVNGSSVITSGGVLQNVTASTAILTSGTLGVARGGTGLSSYSTGDLLYASGATSLAKLADVATGSCLISGGVGAAPQWGSCAAGGGITGSGTTDTIALFTSSGVLGDSWLNQSGTTLQLATGKDLSLLGGDVTANNFNGNLNGNVSGSAGTATALAADPSDCAANSFAISIDAGGNLGCSNVNLGTTAVTGNLLASNLQNAAADLGNADINVDLSNSHAGHVTNLTLDGALIAGTINGATVTSTAFNGVAIGGGSVTANLTGNVTGNVSGNAGTATALAADPADCAANSFATAINASGTLSCASIAANNLPSVAADLGANTVAINLSNSHAGFVTNLTINGAVSAATFSGNLTGDVTGNVTGNVSGNAGTATALASNPGDCASNSFATSIDAGGNLTCANVNVGTADITGNLLASNLQNAAADLGNADINVVLSNNHVGHVTNLTLNGVLSANSLAIGGNSVVTSGGVLQNVTASTSILTSGTLGVARGGTGAGSLTAGGILIGNGTSAISALADTASGACLLSNGAGVAPVWGSCASGGGITGSGTIGQIAFFNSGSTLGGDAGLTYDDSTQTLTVTNLQGALTGNVTGNVNGDVTGNVTGNVSGNAGTATALASNPGDCASNSFATSIDAGGNLSCANINVGTADITGNLLASNLQNAAADLGNADVNVILSNSHAGHVTNLTTNGTITAATFSGNLTGNASTATALAANPTDCASNTFATTIDTGGNLTCSNVNLASAAVTGNLLATNLQNAAADLGNVDINVVLSNNHAGHVTNLTLNGTVSAATFTGALTGNVTGNVSGNAGTATALAADPADCAANSFATAINASGTLSCASIAANNLPSTGADLGAANITVDLSNIHSGFNTNLITDGTINGATIISTSFNGVTIGSGAVNGLTISSGALSGVTGITFSSGNLALGGGNITGVGSVTATTFNGALSGNATTATALAADPADCAANTFAQSIVASGALTCAHVNVGSADITGNLLASNLQNAAVDLGAADVNLNLSNSHAGFNTNLVLDGTITAGTYNGVTIGSGAVNGVTISSGALSGITGITFTSGNLALGGGNITGAGSVTATTFNGALSGNATTATALAADPADCGANTFATAINASGTLSCISIAANNLPNAAADLGAANVTVDLSNSHAGFNTNLVTDGTINGLTITSGALSGVTGITFTSGNLALGGGNITGAGSITATTFNGALSGNASTATALAADPADCGANSFATAINASGTLSCLAIAANNLPSAAADLGASNVNIDLSNSHAGVNTNLTIDGTLAVGSTINGLTVSAGALSGVTGLTFGAAGTLDLASSNVTNGGTITATTFNGALTGNATTATALQATPTGCGANTFARSIAANGNLTCATPNLGTADVTGTLTTNKGGTGLTSFTANGVLYASSTSAIGQLTGTNGQLLLSNAGTPAFTTISGDVTINGTGVTAIGTSKVTGTMILDGTISNADLGSGSYGNITGLGTLGSLTVSGSASLGSTSVSALRVGTSATAGYVLTADASGNATWQAQEIQAVYNGNTLESGGNIIWTGSGTTTSGLLTLSLPAGLFSTIFSAQATAVGGTNEISAPLASIRSVTNSSVTASAVIGINYPGCSGLGNCAAADTTVFAPNGTTVYITIIGR
ncbi:MAG TPA: MerR family DNA-binding transcriptional regulator [Candidatus Saccharimonadales bacterium]|nr:MerR family DNA-binding transcriptional regulator [Candidatus Saccharimonadales bacterium]